MAHLTFYKIIFSRTQYTIKIIFPEKIFVYNFFFVCTVQAILVLKKSDGLLIQLYFFNILVLFTQHEIHTY